MMLTNIPFFKDILVVSFTCEYCGHRNNEIQNAGVLADKGHKITLKVICKEDMDRDICKGEFATAFVPELGLEVPFNKKGHMSTLEGFLTGFKEDLQMQQLMRRVPTFLPQKDNPDTADQIDQFITRLDKYIAADDEILPFTFEIEDPAGNSYIKNDNFPQADSNLKIEHYSRSTDQLRMMGYQPENAIDSVATTEEEKNKAVREKFTQLKVSDAKKAEVLKMCKELQERANEPGVKNNYSAKDADKMLHKAEEINKKYSAHKMDFCKPLEMAEVEGRSSLNLRPDD